MYAKNHVFIVGAHAQNCEQIQTKVTIYLNSATQKSKCALHTSSSKAARVHSPFTHIYILTQRLKDCSPSNYVAAGPRVTHQLDANVKCIEPSVHPVPATES